MNPSRGSEGEFTAEQEPGCGSFRRSLRRRPPAHPQSVRHKKQAEAFGFPLECLPGDSSLLWLFHVPARVGFSAAAEPGSFLLDRSGSRCPGFLLLFICFCSPENHYSACGEGDQ